LIDDEKREMDSYVMELELSEYQYEVSFQKEVDAALEFVQENLKRIDLLILDIMMPPGSAFKDVDTKMGLRTGIHFYETIRETAPDLPVMILTNVSDERVADRFRRENKCWFLRKEDYLPFELAEEVKHVLARSQNRE
jgi:CheY-like chemotaxis protein